MEIEKKTEKISVSAIVFLAIFLMVHGLMGEEFNRKAYNVIGVFTVVRAMVLIIVLSDE